MDGYSRRSWVRLLGGSTALIAISGPPRRASAFEPLEVGVEGNALAAIVKQIGGNDVRVIRSKSGHQIHIAGADHPCLPASKLKGKGAARARFLDDARFAPSVGATVRDLLAAADPAHAARFAENHKAWSRAFALEVVTWTKRLRASVVAGKRVRDPYGRIYLLEWAGATLDPASPRVAPPKLAKLADGPSDATMSAYKAYIERLVRALA
jgi:hypothetical protein